MQRMTIARWEAKGGKRWLELYRDDLGYTYHGDGQGGNIGAHPNDDTAIAYMESHAVSVLRFDFPSAHRVQ